VVREQARIFSESGRNKIPKANKGATNMNNLHRGKKRDGQAGFFLRGASEFCYKKIRENVNKAIDRGAEK
jgi:hypothetical protein